MAVSKEPNGRFQVHARFKLPQNESTYGAVNFKMIDKWVELYTHSCSQEEGRVIAAKFREANPNIELQITWDGPQTL